MTVYGLPAAWERQLLQQAQAYPKPSGYKPDYGTAGFRTEASLLPSTVFRCAVLMAARSRMLGKTTGIMITASHNPVQDNGVKLVDPGGEMLAVSWEAMATSLAQADTAEVFVAGVQKLYSSERISPTAAGRVLVAHDNRPSCPELLAAAVSGANIGGGDGLAFSMGEQTTPCLHWGVMQHGTEAEEKLEAAYIQSLASGYVDLVAEGPNGSAQASSTRVLVDCANGVGSHALKQLTAALAKVPNGGKAAADSLNLQLINTGEGQLNGECGADYVQKERSLPAGINQALEKVSADKARCVSIDGDADRVVYFLSDAGKLRLYDGDRIAVLAALLFNQLSAQLGKAGPKLKMGVVQTAYANGNSTQYMRGVIGCEVVLTATGVKWLHAAAHKFDVGVYFEANGHGTVLFSKEACEKLQVASEAANGSSAAAAAKKILALSKVLNQAVGDALSGILLVEGALRLTGLTMQSWADLYRDLPSRMLKVEVPDRTKVVPNSSETRVLEPPSLQPLIDKSVAQVASGRAFVRPSGTEDVVRVYAEGDTQQAADDLAARVSQHVKDVLACL